MTTDERFDRLEHWYAGFSERWKQEREEDRALLRETQRNINTLSRKMVEVEEQMLRNAEQFAQHRKEQTERDKGLDERIDKLVSAMGEYIRRTNAGQGDKV